MHGLPNFADTTSIQVFWQSREVRTEEILAECLYTIDDPDEIREIVESLNLIELSGAAQRKAANWIIFKLRDGTELRTDLDQEAGELRVKCSESIREFKLTGEAVRRLDFHIQRAKQLYQDAHGR